ncbi:TRPM8 channel-associated factor 2 isoform X1 [Penaeus vannamei]|uniref:TRPM8 channel-associated factor 2 isoform X1 n=2 Tax=Penaeus vannamei TaxID=6689 RepID=UPI00387F9B08
MATAEGNMAENSAASDMDTDQGDRPESHKRYLINQATHTCLAVIGGSSPENAVIGMTSPSDSREKQWYNSGGQWQWGGDRSYCLAPVPGDITVRLVKCASSTIKWTKDAEGRMVFGSRVLTVPPGRHRTRVILRSTINGTDQMWWTDAELRAFLKGASPAVYPFPSVHIAIYYQEIARGLLNQLAPLSEPLPFPRDVATFPGTVDDATPRVEKTFTLDLSVLGQASNLRMTTPRDWQATDLYVAAGDIFLVTLPESLPLEQARQITVCVGAHVDKLRPSSGTTKKSKWFKRMPVVSETFNVNPGINLLRSQYGGNLIFIFREGEVFLVDVNVKNVIRAPHFKLDKTTVHEWRVSRTSGAPHAVLESHRIVLVVRSSAVTSFAFPDQLMCRYEDIVDKLNSLAGFTESDPPPRGKYWLVNDLQISHGSAHAGFPVMVNRRIRNLAMFDTPHRWCVWHELGHNYQQARSWARAYGVESTVNLFSIYIGEKLFNKDRLKKNDKYRLASAAVDQGLTFEEANCWQKLVFLMEIKYAFPDKGWDMFRQLNRTTRALSKKEAELLASDHQLQIDYVYRTLSKIVGHDLILTYKRWGLSVSQDAQEEIQKLGLQKAPADLSVRH